MRAAEPRFARSADAGRCAARATVRGYPAWVFQRCAPFKPSSCRPARLRLPNNWSARPPALPTPLPRLLVPGSKHGHCHPSGGLRSMPCDERGGGYRPSLIVPRAPVPSAKRRASPGRVRHTPPLAVHLRGTTVVMAVAAGAVCPHLAHIHGKSHLQWLNCSPPCGGGLRQATGRFGRRARRRWSGPLGRAPLHQRAPAAACATVRRRASHVHAACSATQPVASFHGRASRSTSGPLHCSQASGSRFRSSNVPWPSIPRSSPPWFWWLCFGRGGPQAPAAQQVHAAEAPIGAPLMLALCASARTEKDSTSGGTYPLPARRRR